MVKEQGAEEIRRIATAVSDPTSSTYGEFLGTEQVLQLTQPEAADMTAVIGWLTANGVSFQTSHSNVVASMSVGAASELFSTNFHIAQHVAHGQSLVRASDYEIPAEVERSLQTIFGLHGLPLPPRQAITTLAHGPSRPAQPANVTPAVIASTYGIPAGKASGSEKNKQAVAEFQGQFMNSTDLVNYFKAYVTDYTEGTDDVVFKFVGEHKENSGGIEAELDIQYIMGPAVGIKTEFWEFPGQDFGNDLNQWTANLTALEDRPIVHSVSYGWQGNLSQIHVKDADVEAVDSNFQKLASMGVSIMISSGDSGSGYTRPDPMQQCMGGGEKGVGVTGTVKKSKHAEEAEECCEVANDSEKHPAAAWTFTKEKGPDMAGNKKKGICTIYSSVTGRTQTNKSSTSGFAPEAKHVQLWPSWPASSPWVTAVGATRFQEQKVGNDEMATDQFVSTQAVASTA